MKKKLSALQMTNQQNDKGIPSPQNIVERLEANPATRDDFEKVLLLAKAYLDVYQEAKTVALLKPWADTHENDPRFLTTMAYAHKGMEDYAAATRYFKKAVRFLNDDEKIWNEMCQCGAMVPFRRRMRDFWQWFLLKEPTILRMLNADHLQPEEIMSFMNQGVEILGEGIHYNMGGHYEFTFSVESVPNNFFLYHYVVEHMPEVLRERWKFSSCNKGFTSSFVLDIYGVNCDVEEARFLPVFNEKSARFDMKCYHHCLVKMPEWQALEMANMMLDVFLGEVANYLYTGEVEIVNDAPKGGVSVLALKAMMGEELKQRGKRMHDKRITSFVSYTMLKDEQKLREDIIAGITCFPELCSEYYEESGYLFDLLRASGVQAVSILMCFRQQNIDKMDYRERWAQRLEEEILKPFELGVVTGGAIGQHYCYTDLLIYDDEAFCMDIRPWLRQFSEVEFYYSEMRYDGMVFSLMNDETVS